MGYKKLFDTTGFDPDKYLTKTPVITKEEETLYSWNLLKKDGWVQHRLSTEGLPDPAIELKKWKP